MALRGLQDSILEWMQPPRYGAHSIKEVADALKVPTSRARPAMIALEKQGALVRVALDPITFKLGGCYKNFKTAEGLNVRCTQRQFHEEHQTKDFKEVE